MGALPSVEQIEEMNGSDVDGANTAPLGGSWTVCTTYFGPGPRDGPWATCLNRSMGKYEAFKETVACREEAKRLIPTPRRKWEGRAFRLVQLQGPFGVWTNIQNGIKLKWSSDRKKIVD